MSLVAYASSDDEDSNSETETTDHLKNTGAILKAKPQNYEPNNIPSSAASAGVSSSSSFNKISLPKPVSSKNAVHDGYEDDVVEDEFKKLPVAVENLPTKPKASKVRKPVKIAAITVTDFDSDDEDEPSSKKLKKSVKGSGLTAMLPAPKNVIIKETNRALVPHTLTKRPVAKPTVKPKQTVSKPSATKTNVQPLKSGVYNDSDDDDGDDDTVDFFSLDKPDANSINLPPPISVTPVTSSISDYSNTDIDNRSVLPGSSTDVGYYGDDTPVNTEHVYDYQQDKVTQEAPMENSPGGVENYLQDEEFLKLAGKKRRGEEINIIDVHADDQISRVELTKSLTEEVDMRTQSQRRKDMPSGQHRRKHQITYLAYQAKEREIELKNQWAQNRMNRRTAQNKYGF